MFKPGTDILFQEPDCEVRRLRRSVVVEASEGRIAVRFVGEPFAFEPGLDVLMYFNLRREFVQQVARVVEVVVGSEPEPVFALEPLGDPTSAECRQHYRVSTVAAGIEARIAAEAKVPVQDLSATGLAVVARGDYSLGETVEVGIEHDDESCHGVASVRSVRELGPGRTRYGLRAIERDPHTNVFLEVLQRISLAVQREQLQRAGGGR